MGMNNPPAGGGGSPGGTNGQLQYNNSGSFGGLPVVANSAGQITLIGGTTTNAPLIWPAGTLNTTVQLGAMEFDGLALYFAMKLLTRQVVTTKQIEVLSANHTLVSQTAAQALLDATTNGAITLPVGTYRFRCYFALAILTNGASSFGFAFGGTATRTEAWTAHALKAVTLSAAVAANTSLTFNTAANTTLTNAGNGTNGIATIEGTVRITVTGTLIPQVSQIGASAAVVQANSFFEIEPIGAAAVTTVGNWS